MSETVNHPKHYNRENGMECIDEMVLIFGIEEVKTFCKLNAWKYRYRAADKNGEEDLKKSDWYINKYKELCGKEEKTIIPPSTIISVPDYPRYPSETPSNPYNPHITWTYTTKDDIN